MRKYVVRFMVFYILSIGCLLGIIIYSYQNKIDHHNEQVEIEYLEYGSYQMNMIIEILAIWNSFIRKTLSVF